MVQASDGRGASAVKRVTVNVPRDRNAPTFDAVDSRRIPENTEVNSIILNVHAQDRDLRVGIREETWGGRGGGVHRA